jgi:hypothetical protein
MGWWPINPETGKPTNAPSRLSQVDSLVLLNAVPGIDDDAAAHYLGDPPWDLAADTARMIQIVLENKRPLSEVEARRLLLNRQPPSGAESLEETELVQLLQITDVLWRDVDACYQEDWGRPARPAERRWVAEYAVRTLIDPGE